MNFIYEIMELYSVKNTEYSSIFYTFNSVRAYKFLIGFLKIRGHCENFRVYIPDTFR